MFADSVQSQIHYVKTSQTHKTNTRGRENSNARLLILVSTIPFTVQLNKISVNITLDYYQVLESLHIALNLRC